MEKYHRWKHSILPHHFEKEVIRVEIIFGKDHDHLIIKEGESEESFVSKNRDEAIKEGIKFLEKHRSH